MKCLITFTSGLSAEQGIEADYKDIRNIYQVGKPLLREDGTVYDVIAKVEIMVEREGSPTLYLDLSEHVNETVVEEILNLDEPLTWDSEKYRYVANDMVLKSGVVCRIIEMTNDISEIHLMVMTKEQAQNPDYALAVYEARIQRFGQMTITGLVDVVKANYLNFLGTIYAYSLNEEKTDMHPYVKAIQELIPTAVYVSKDPFYIQCIAKDGVLKIVLRQMEDGQLGIEFLKEKAEQKDAAAN